MVSVKLTNKLGRKYMLVSNIRPEEDRHIQPVKKEALFRFR